MKSLLLSLLAILAFSAAAVRLETAAAASSQNAVAAPTSPASKTSPIKPEFGVAELQPAFKQYCVTCHNERLKTANLFLDKANFQNVLADAEVWERVLHKLKTGAMPPPGLPHPEPAAMKSIIGSLEGALDSTYITNPNPGRSLIHRLNRAEYRNAIRDLLALDIDLDQSLPADDSDHGFDNISELLKVSPLLMSRYLSIAERISAIAVGDPEFPEETRTWSIPADESEGRHVPGMPLGTIGGIKIRQNFPLDADYEFRVSFWGSEFGGSRGLGGMEQAYRFEITVDGVAVHSVQIGGKEFDELNYRSTAVATKTAEDRMKARVHVKAGPHEVTFQFVPPSTLGVTQEHLQPVIRSSPDAQETFGAPKLTSVLISGPTNVSGSGDTPSRRKIFICHPVTAREESQCATKILSTLARQGYGRPLTSAERDDLVAFYQRARIQHSFEAAVQAALPRIIAGPEFLIRHYPAPSNLVDGAVYQITDAELASRLALFLWSSIPDDRLIDLAAQGKLRNPGTLEEQIRRMLADPKSEALISNFGGQWLWLRNLPNITPDLYDFPEFDDNLRQSFLRETQLFFGSIVHEDRSALDLLNADYTFVNERLARHYGIPNVYGPRFRRVHIADENRRGLLGQGSFLSVTGVGTAPVQRGKWVLSQLFNSPPPPPPPDVPSLAQSESATVRSVRQMLEVHRKQSPCSTCHRLMDPIGLALENFDAIGQWRDTDRGQPIDASTTLFTGEKVSGPVELRRALSGHADVIVETLTENLMTYALGRGVEIGNMPAVREVVRAAGRDDYRFSSLVAGIVRSVPFQMRVKRTEGLVATAR